MTETQTPIQEQEYAEQSPIYTERKAEVISAAIVTLALTIGQEQLGIEAGVAFGIAHGLIFGAMKEAWVSHINDQEVFDKEGIGYMVKGTLKAITAPFLLAGVIENHEAIENVLNSIDNSIGISEGLSDLADQIGTFIQTQGPKIALGTAAMTGSIKIGQIALKKVQIGLVGAKQMIVEGMDEARAYSQAREIVNPVAETRSPIEKFELKWRWPVKLQGILRRKRSPKEEGN